jgi:type II secretory pathway component GspD/PulD (secretin)
LQPTKQGCFVYESTAFFPGRTADHGLQSSTDPRINITLRSGNWFSPLFEVSLMSRTIVGLLFASLVVAPLVLHAQEPAPAVGGERMVYLVKHGSAKDLAAALAQHFKGDAEILAVAEPTGNCLLLRGKKEVLAEVLRTLAMLDRQPRLVHLEIVLAELTPGKTDAEEAEGEDREFSGPLTDVLRKVQSLQSKGRVAALKRINLATLENQKATVMLGETRPMVLGSSRTATGLMTSNINYRDFGTSLRLTPRISDDGVVALELDLEDSRMSTPEDGVAIGTSETGRPVRASEFLRTQWGGKLSIPSGHAVLAKGVRNDTKTAQNRTLVIVTARVADSKPAK